MAEIHHETIYFAGYVQGVGFRYATLQVAREFEVAGYAQNMADGRVLVEVEGTAAEVTAYVAAVQEKMHGYLRKVERTGSRRAPQFSGFVIK